MKNGRLDLTVEDPAVAAFGFGRRFDEFLRLLKRFPERKLFTEYVREDIWPTHLYGLL